jgi:hypothetical protein
LNAQQPVPPTVPDGPPLAVLLLAAPLPTVPLAPVPLPIIGFALELGDLASVDVDDPAEGPMPVVALVPLLEVDGLLFAVDPVAPVPVPRERGGVLLASVPGLHG